MPQYLPLLENIRFGNYAAEADYLKDAPEVFVKTRQSKAFNMPEYKIILGRKGSGKTALTQQFSQNYKENYDYLLAIETNNEYEELLRKCSEIYSIESSSLYMNKAIASIWEYSILTSCMNLVLDANKYNNSKPYSDLRKYLKKEGILKKKTSELLLRTSENILKLSIGKRGEYLSDILRDANTYIYEQEYETAKDSLHEILQESKGILVTFDRIDTYYQVEEELGKDYELDRYISRVTLTGLIQAVYNISISSFRKLIDFKVFLPVDKFEVLRLRDLDKIKDFIYEIEWTPQELKEFMARRIAYGLNLRDTHGDLLIDVDNTLYKIFPRTITNLQVSNIIENVDDYLIRHTQYKPRDLQYYCSQARRLAISDPQTEARGKISEEQVREAVNRYTKELVDNFFLEVSYDYPYLRKLILGFSGYPNIMSYSEEFFPRISQTLKSKKIRCRCYEAIKILYKFGFFGVITDEHNVIGDYAPTRKVKGRVYSFYFSYIDPSYEFDNSKKIAIHPMFNEYLHLQVNNEIIVG